MMTWFVALNSTQKTKHDHHFPPLFYFANSTLKTAIHAAVNVNFVLKREDSYSGITYCIFIFLVSKIFSLDTFLVEVDKFILKMTTLS